MTEFPAALPHGPITEVFPDVFMVTSGFRFAPLLSITRNMTIVRQGEELTIVNSARLSSEGEAQLEKLGKVKHLVRLGAFHGLDDPYYMNKYSPKLWAPPGMQHAPGLVTHQELRPGSSPIEKSSIFVFEHAAVAEGIINLEVQGGVLLTCDSYQNWTNFDGCSLLGRLMMKVMGFGPTLIGGPWAKKAGPEVRADFDRLLEEPFKHLIPGHGAVSRDKAKEGLKTAIANRFKD